MPPTPEEIAEWVNVLAERAADDLTPELHRRLTEIGVPEPERYRILYVADDAAPA